MKIYLKSGRICKTSNHFMKVEFPKIWRKTQSFTKPVISAWNSFKFQETPLMQMYKLQQSQ